MGGGGTENRRSAVGCWGVELEGPANGSLSFVIQEERCRACTSTCAALLFCLGWRKKEVLFLQDFWEPFGDDMRGGERYLDGMCAS